MKVCVYTSVCEDDTRWTAQYLAELTRLSLPFVMHFDRCSHATKKLIGRHPLCHGTTTQDDFSKEFTEQHKQAAFDTVARLGFDFALATDIDETYERDAPAKLASLDTAYPDADYLQARWINLWGDKDHMRVDGPFDGSLRVKLYRLNTGIEWCFDHPITNGAKPVNRDEESVRLVHTDLVCLHWGLMHHELRVQHKERWDRIYAKAVGANPYGAWRYALDPDIAPQIVRHNYL